jgi:hypothetical protein
MKFSTNDDEKGMKMMNVRDDELELSQGDESVFSEE